MKSNIVVGVDGSVQSRRAVEWCADHAAGLRAEVVAAYRVVVKEGTRDRGEVTEHALGSTTHKLTHHLDRPLVIVP